MQFAEFNQSSQHITPDLDKIIQEKRKRQTQTLRQKRIFKSHQKLDNLYKFKNLNIFYRLHQAIP